MEQNEPKNPVEHLNDVCARCGKLASELSDYDEACSVYCWAQVVDSRRFNYGLAGAFTFDEPQPYKDGDSICNKCTGEVGFKPSYDVNCDRCHKKYQACWILKDRVINGFGCASTTYHRHLTGDDRHIIDCGYGSKYDMNVYEIVGGTIQLIKDWSLVCDTCIDECLQAGYVKLLSAAF